MLHSMKKRPRFAMLNEPTPVQRLSRLEEAIGASETPAIYVKRDDLMGTGGGGNKLRKLEYLIGEALAQGCDTFITTGARQSNHARLTAAACASAGLACELVLTDTVPREDELYRQNGNVLLDHLFGASLRHEGAGADALAIAHERAAELSAAGRNAFVVGAGGSSPLGCLGYVACSREITEQERSLDLRFAAIVVPNGSSGTHAGLAAGLKAMGEDPSRVRSFTVLAPIERARASTAHLAGETLALLQPGSTMDADAIVVSGDQLGDGYGIPTDAMLEAVRLIARTEGLLVDPVYGGKALAGLLEAVRSGTWRSTEAVLFVMTGGLPGLFAYEPTFRTPSSFIGREEG